MKWSRNPFALMAMLLVLWGSFAAVSKWTLYDLTVWQMQFYMFAIAMVTMLAALPFRNLYKQFRSIGKKEIAYLSLIGFISYLYYAFYTTALKFIPAIEASMLNYLFPIAVVFFAILLNGERINFVKSMLFLFSLAGTYLIISNGNLLGFRLTNIWGDLLAIGGALMWGLFSNLGNKIKAPLFASVFIYATVSFLCSLFAMTLFSEWAIPDWDVLGAVGWLSLSNVIGGYFIWFRALQVASVSLVSALAFITPFVTLLFIVLLLGESVSWFQIAGLLIILASIFVQQQIERRQKPSEQAERAIPTGR